MMFPVSVVIPCRNMAGTLGRAIESALVAGSNDVMVIDDASHDDPAGAVHSWRYTRIRSTGACPIGVCGARNLGIHLAEHELIVPLDADDELLPDGLAWLVNAYDPGVLVYGGWEENGQAYSAPPEAMITRKNVAHATWLFAKADWRGAGGYDPDFGLGGEDYAFMLALVENGVKPVRVDHPIYRRGVGLNQRTMQARDRWPVILQLVREKYPGVFADAIAAHS